jgi:hypothetical protein
VHKHHKLGRITSVEIALGGKYNSELGLLITMGAAQHNGQTDSAWSVVSFDGVRHNYMRGDEELVAYLVNYLGHLLLKADVTKVSDLVNKPVLCEFEEGELTSWRLWDRTV